MKFGIDYGIIYAVYCIVSKKWYIGQTIQSLERRKSVHKYDSLTKCDNIIFHRAIRKYGIENFLWFVIEDNIPVPYHFEGRKKIMDCKAIDEREIYWIAEKNSYEQGYNMTRGGHDTSAVVSCIPICQYNLNGELINCYFGIKDAGRETKILYTKIIRCLKGDRPSAGGFMWRYIIDGNIIEKIDPYKKKTNIDKRKKICQYTKDGVFIKQFDSCTEAAKEVGISNGKITLCANGKRPLAGGYGWAYAS